MNCSANPMKTFVTYHVGYDFGDGSQAVVYEIKAASMPHAYDKCLRRHRGCRLLGGYRQDESGAITRYEAPSQVAVGFETAPDPVDIKFAFFDECEGRRRRDMPDWRQPNGIAISRPI
jgi:hypothetical protein